jgi:hypothetical protein
MALPVNLRLSVVVAILDYSDRSQFIGSPPLKLAALQSIRLFQVPLHHQHGRFCLLRKANAAITWPQGLNGEEDDLAVAAQVYGDVIRSSML